MLFIEFQLNLNYGVNIIKYKNIDDDNWFYLYIDIETLNLLILIGIISTYKIPTIETCADNELTSKNIKLKYCNAEILFYCDNNTKEFNLSKLEQNY
jgi:hypothetical protein